MSATNSFIHSSKAFLNVIRIGYQLFPFLQLWCVQSFKKYARFKELLSGEGAIAGAIPHIYPMGKGINSNTSNTAPAYPGLLFLCAERCFEPLREESRVINTRTRPPPFLLARAVNAVSQVELVRNRYVWISAQLPKGCPWFAWIP